MPLLAPVISTALPAIIMTVTPVLPCSRRLAAAPLSAWRSTHTDQGGVRQSPRSRERTYASCSERRMTRRRPGPHRRRVTPDELALRDGAGFLLESGVVRCALCATLCHNSQT